MPSANNPTRVVAGFLDASQESPYANFRQLRPTSYAEDFDDFYSYLATNWVKTDTGTGTIVVGSAATGVNGRLLVTNTAAGANDALSIQWGGASGAVSLPFTPVSTQDLFVATTFQMDSVLLASVVIGLAATDTTPVASLPANGIFFSMSATGDLNLILAKGGVNTTVQLVPAAALAAATDYECVAVYTASDNTVRAYVNGVAKMPTTGWPTFANMPIVALTKTIGVLNVASAVAHSASLDYLFVAQRRVND
jgi:hypothetical protein